MFFTLMSCTGKTFVFLQTERSVSFPQMCAWNVMAFRKKHVKIKNKVYSIFFCDIFEILVSFLCWKQKKTSFSIFFLMCGAASRYQKYGAWDCGPLALDPPLKPPVHVIHLGSELLFFSTNTFDKVVEWLTQYHLLSDVTFILVFFQTFERHLT